MTKSGPQNNYVTPAVDLICDLHLRCTIATLSVARAPPPHTEGFTSVFYKPMRLYFAFKHDILTREGPGDILLFLTGQDEIDKACLQIQKFTKVGGI